jgi:hypothetical protein
MPWRRVIPLSTEAIESKKDVAATGVS